MRRLDRVPDRLPDPSLVRLPDRPAPITKTRLRFRARTSRRWLDAVLISPHRRLVDAINRDDIAGMLVVDELQVVDTIGNPDDASQRAEYGCVNTAEVLFFIPIEEETPVARDSFARVKKRPERVKVGIGPFEIEGNVYRIENATLRHVIGLPKPSFLVLASATVRQVDENGATNQFDLIFVNRRFMDFIMPVEPG